MASTAAEKILQAHQAALLKRAKSGKPLTAAQLAVVQAEASGVEDDVETYVENLSDLAKVLGITRPTLNVWRQMPGAPKADSGGRYNTAAWLRFRDERGLKGSETDAELTEKMRAIRLRNEDLELDLRIKFGEFTENVEVVEEFGRLAADQKELLRQKLEVELPGKLPKELQASAREMARKLVDDICASNQKLIDRYIARVEAARLKVAEIRQEGK